MFSRVPFWYGHPGSMDSGTGKIAEGLHEAVVVEPPDPD